MITKEIVYFIDFICFLSIKHLLLQSDLVIKILNQPTFEM